MVCQGCHRLTRNDVVCEACRRLMRPAPERILCGGIRVMSAFEHDGPAKTLAHNLKYRGVTGYADLVARILAPRLAPAPLVPIPRALSRRIRYGIDPALTLAKMLSRQTGFPVARLLAAPIHTPRRAGGDHGRPVVPPRVLKRPLEKVTLVDDVMTTGATLEVAVSAIGQRNVGSAVVANAVPGVSSLLDRGPRVVPERSIVRGLIDGVSTDRR